MEEILGQQQEFLENYRKVAKNENQTDEAIISQVLQELEISGQDTFTLSPQESKGNKSIDFPFEKSLFSREYDGAINSKYTYLGEPFEVEKQTDEQHEW